MSHEGEHQCMHGMHLQCLCSLGPADVVALTSHTMQLSVLVAHAAGNQLAVLFIGISFRTAWAQISIMKFKYFP